MSLNMKGYESFVLAVVNRLEELYNGFYTVELTDILKNNDCQKSAVVARNKDMCISVILYLKEAYQRYCNGTSFEEIIEDFKKSIDHQNGEANQFKNVKRISSFSYIRSHLIYKVVGYSSNKMYLKDKPYIKVCNMAITFHVLASMKENCIGSYAVTKSMMDIWGMQVEDLYAAAKENTPKLMPAKFERLSNVLRNLLGDMSSDEAANFDAEGIDFEADGPELYILSNRSGINGAATIMYPGILKEIAEEIGSDELVILPSSIHEVLIFGKENLVSKDDIQGMVRDINQTQVLPEEVLTDTPYIYDVKSDSLDLL